MHKKPIDFRCNRSCLIVLLAYVHASEDTPIARVERLVELFEIGRDIQAEGPDGRSDRIRTIMGEFDLPLSVCLTLVQLTSPTRPLAGLLSRGVRLTNLECVVLLLERLDDFRLLELLREALRRRPAEDRTIVGVSPEVASAVALLSAERPPRRLRSKTVDQAHGGHARRTHRDRWTCTALMSRHPRQRRRARRWQIIDLMVECEF